MKYPLLIALFLIACCSLTYGQTLKGNVTESGTGNKMDNVFVHDVTNRQMTITDKNGNFAISTEVGHTIVFESPGYASDTMYVINLAPKKIKLVEKTIALREVTVKASKNKAPFDPQTEYPEVYTRSKLYVLSPTSWFSKDARDARRLKKYFRTEQQEREVDEVFNRSYVSSLVPLRGQDLDNFMTLYRPSYAFVHSNSAGSMTVYINDSYKKYIALPPDKRQLPTLQSDEKPVDTKQ